MSTHEARARLAERQASLMGAVTTLREDLPGFEATQIAAAALSLKHKRLRVAARAWPALFAALGDDSEALFATYASRSPLPKEGGPLADGRGFADFLTRLRRLPEAGRLEVLFVDLYYRRTPLGLAPRRGATLRASLLRNPYRLVVGFRLPFLGVRWFSCPLAGSATNTNRAIPHPLGPAD
jgi:hypothetical protein